MLLAVFSDVHANLPALQAVLSAVHRRNPDCILSLGDQVNLGPCPKETLSLLRENRVVCLRGNHERYILSAMDGDAAFRGINFESLRFNATLLSREEIELPEVIDLSGVTFCHSLPGDDTFPVHDPHRALPQLIKRYTKGMTRIICGHGHNPTEYILPHLRLNSIGSVGCMDDGVSGTAPYVMIELSDNTLVLRPYYAAYDVRELPSLFLFSGMTDFCPVIAHIACLQMTRARDFLVPFVTEARKRSAFKGETVISKETWNETDMVFSWPDGKTTGAFWRDAVTSPRRTLQTPYQ